MDRQAGFFAKRFDKLGRRVRLAQSGHVLDGEDVCTDRLELSRELHIVVQVILRPLRIEDVARVADRRFANRAGLDRGFHRHAHVGRPVECVEDAEDVHPRGGRLADALADDVVGIIRISHRARRSQQHLEQDVRNPLAKLLKPLPGRLFEKPHRGVECCAAPHFQREQPRAIARIHVGDFQQVVGPHTRCQQRLMGVAHRRIRPQQRLLLANPRAELLDAELFEFVAGALGQRSGSVKCRNLCRNSPRGAARP